MKTAEGMYQYCLDNNYGAGLTRNWGIKHFQVIEDMLMNDEDVLMTFIGIHEGEDGVSGGNFGYALTNKRLILGQKKMIGKINTAINLDKLNDISSSTGMVLGAILFDTLGEKFKTTVNKAHVEPIANKLNELIFTIKSDSSSNQSAKGDSSVDEIRKYKSLLDDGIITEEEFEQKKKELLGL